MLKRTPLLAVFIAGFITVAVIYCLEIPARRFSNIQIILLYIISYCVAMGIALLFDPKSAEHKERFLKINFYEEK